MSTNGTQHIADVRTEKRIYCGHTGTHYRWEHNGRGIYDNSYYSNAKSEVLTLLNVDRNDDGIYRCTYYHNQWQHVDFYLVVKDIRLPMIYLPSSHDIAAVGADVLLKCTFGQTIPKTTTGWWTKFNNGLDKNLSGSDEQKYHVGSIQSLNLNIYRVTESDSGEYRCYGANKNGGNFLATQLMIGYPPVVSISQKCYVIILGGDVTIEVSVRNVPPGSTINWTQWRTYINKSHRHTIGELRNPFLTIRNVELKDAGNYTLYVQNTYGNHSSLTVLKVISATIKGYKGYRKLEKKANDSFTIECEVFGGIAVTWRKNGNQLKGVNQLILKIKKISRVNKGNYTCETNLETVTARSSIVQLDVKDKPLVTTTRTTIEGNKGVDIVLPCSHDSNPTPTHVYWIKNGVNISADRTTKYNGSTIVFPSLVIHDAEKSDSGIYICSLSNKLGIGYSKPFQLVIRDTPSSERKNYSYKTPLIITLSVIGIILIFVGLVVCYK
ncbi:hemicentin-1-like [Mytilus trossulus]|uniref:hemicentin-1-like n=1 Tax=Mytilus trossulus TaxID=6551 RepID=UPI0030062666